MTTTPPPLKKCLYLQQIFPYYSTLNKMLGYENKYDIKIIKYQSAKKEVSDNPGLVDFAIGLDNSVFNLPDGQEMFSEEFE